MLKLENNPDVLPLTEQEEERILKILEKYRFSYDENPRLSDETDLIQSLLWNYKKVKEAQERKDTLNLSDITDEHALATSKILGGATHVSVESQIHQMREVLSRRWNMQTNIPGIGWYRAWKYLQGLGYKIDELPTDTKEK